MNFLTSIHHHSRVNDFLLLVVRLFIGFGMISHGFPKIMKLSSGEPIEFYNLLGLGQEFTLGLCVFVEVVCSIFIILGLFTRGALIFLIGLTFVISFVVHSGATFSDREMALLYLSVYLLLIAFGPGKFSVDGMITKRRERSAW